MRQYRKKPGQVITAVRLGLETEGFTYHKWGSEQFCKPGDWIVNNQGETYTISHCTFVATYRQVSPGVYAKETVVWAKVAEQPGTVKTHEGSTAYEAGDYLVCNRKDGSDTYAVSRERFESMYEPVCEADS